MEVICGLHNGMHYVYRHHMPPGRVGVDGNRYIEHANDVCARAIFLRVDVYGCLVALLHEHLSMSIRFIENVNRER